MVVESDYVEGARAEEVVARIGFVASGRDGARGIQLPGHVGELLCQQGIDRKGVAFGGEHILFVSEVKDEVGLLERERVGLGVAPLLKHLVADAPYDDGGMVAVAHHEVAQVFLMPFGEITGIVVGGLLLAPHVECLVHHEQAERVAKFEQFGSGGLWVERMALAPISCMIFSWRAMAALLTTAPSAPAS